MNSSDTNILQELGRRVAEIAALPVHHKTAAAWRALNGLRPIRPMFMIDQIPWNEMNVNGELTCLCEDPWCRDIETSLRRTIYRWDHMRADIVVEPFVEIPKAIRNTGFGITVDQDVAVSDPTSAVAGYHYHDQIKDEVDIAKVKTPDVSLDEKATAEAEARAHEIFDGILPVRMQGMFPVYALWDSLVSWHGPEAVLYDLVDRPEFLHALAQRTTEAQMAMLDQVERQGLLGIRQQSIHCTGALCDELPAEGANPNRSRAKDLWTYGMSQIFSTVSPAMHEEFERPYLTPWFERFGLVYYGCCEPLDDKIEMIRTLPNVRKVSMSPWVDVERGAERLGSDYVFSRKPSPALVAVDDWNPAAVERDLRETLAACRTHACPVELILKDVSTVRYRPQRLWEWNNIASRLVREG